MHPYSISISIDADELALNAARHFELLASQYINSQSRFTVALSGGSTPKKLFSLLAARPFSETIPWQSIFFFWGDERCVPPDHPESNFGMARETFLSKVPIPAENIFRIHAEDSDHNRAAENYSKTIIRFFGESQLSFDLIYLGMGTDGHTASLFPGTSALSIIDKVAVANYVEKLDACRITLTADTINNARNIIFMVAGEDKAEPLRQVLEGDYEPERYPSQLIRPKEGNLQWMVDRAAGALLNTLETK